MSDHTIAHTEDLDGYHIEIRYATVEEYDNPRTNQDNVGTMICFNSRYTLGDKHDFADPLEMIANLAPLLSVDYPGQFMDKDELFYWTEEDMRKSGIPNDARSVHNKMLERLDDEEDLFALPLYLYDHSGITMSTTPFGDRWDSGQVGIIYVKEDAAKKAWPDLFKPVCAADDVALAAYHAKQEEAVLARLKDEVTVYDAYITDTAYTYDVWKIRKPGKKYKRKKSLIDDKYPQLVTLEQIKEDARSYVRNLNEKRRSQQA